MKRGKKVIAHALVIAMVFAALLAGVSGGGLLGTDNAYAASTGQVDRPTLVYNSDGTGKEISDTLTDNMGYTTWGAGDSLIWLGSLSESVRTNSGTAYGQPLWRVVDDDADYNGESGHMFLISEYLWGDPVQQSNADSLLKKIYQSGLFSDAEKAAILSDGKTEDEFKTSGADWSQNVLTLSNDNKLFHISYNEAHNSKYFSQYDFYFRARKGFAVTSNKDAHYKDFDEYWNGEKQAWWIRSVGTFYTSNPFQPTEITAHTGMAYYQKSGDLKVDGYKSEWSGVRPAFNLDLGKVLFMSPDTGGVKSRGDGKLDEVGTFSLDKSNGGTWKFTLLDGSRSEFKVTSAAAIKEEGGDAVTAIKVEYEGAKTGDNEYVSAVVLGNDNSPKFYGRFSTSKANGELTISLDGVTTLKTDKLYVFSEQYNGDCETDLASALQEVKVELPQKAPVVSFDANGGSGTMDPVSMLKPGDKYTIPECGFTAPKMTDGSGSDQIFLGWKIEGGDVRYRPGDTIEVDNDITLIAHWGDSVWKDLQKQIDDAEDGGTITLNKNWYADPSADPADTWLIIPEGKSITIDLNGYTIDRNLYTESGGKAQDDGSAFLVNGSLTIKDTSADNSGKITGGYGSTGTFTDQKHITGSAGGAVTVASGGNLTLESGTLEKNMGGGGAVSVLSGGSFTMNGGSIKDNFGLVGALLIEQGGTGTISGGDISGNLGNVAAVSVYGGELKVTGGKITANTYFTLISELGKGNVYVTEDGAISAEGNPFIAGAVDADGDTSCSGVVLASGVKINVTGDLAESASISVWTLDDKVGESPVVITEGLNGKGSAANFSCSDSSYSVIENEDNEAIIAKVYKIRVSDEVAGGTIELSATEAYAGSTVTITPVPGDNSKYREGTLSAVRSGGISVPVEDNKFVMPADDVTVYAEFVHEHSLEKVEAVAATCKTTGVKEHYKCTSCGKLFEDDQAAIETTAEKLEIPIDADAHVWGSWEVTKAATEEAEGEETRTCSLCGKTETRTTPILEHVHDFSDGMTPGTDPTCLTKGSRAYYQCKTCGLMYADNKGETQLTGADILISPTGHSPVYTYGEKTEATCDSAGGQTVSVDCGTCHTHLNTLHITEYPLGHNVRRVASAATCTLDGAKEHYECKRCGKWYTDSDCETEIADTDKESYTIPATGHKWGSWEKNGSNSHKRVCENDASHVEYEAHSWNDGEVTKAATEDETGIKTFTCDVCGETREEVIPKVDPSPAPSGGDSSASTAVQVLVAKGIAKGKTKAVISWNNVNADRYVVYLAKCNYKNKKYKYKKVKTLSGSKLKYTVKKLKKKTSYKFKVVAQKNVGGSYVDIATSYVGHFCTGNVRGSLTNPKSMTLNMTAVTLRTGGSATISAKVTKVKKGKKFATSHAELLRYKSDNPAVASVDANGNVTAKSPGTATIYVQTINGIWKTCTVTVE